MLAKRALGYCGALAAALTVVAVPYGQAVPQPKSAKPVIDSGDDWDSMAVDIGIDRRLVDSSGAPVDTPAQKKAFRWELSRRGGRWKNVVSVTSRYRPKVQSPTGESIELENPFEIVRFEEEEGSAPRLFDVRGNEVRFPTNFPTRRTAGSPAPGWPTKLPMAESPAAPPPAHAEYKRFAKTLLVTQKDRASRLNDLTNAYGSASGKVHGLERFVRVGSGSLEEALVDDTLAVPVQVNVGRDGALVSRTNYEYAPLGTAGDVVCQRITTEELVAGAGGSRSIVEMSFSNLRLERRK
jgi:hypothetical protein